MVHRSDPETVQPVNGANPSLVAMAGHAQKIVTSVVSTHILCEMLTQLLPGEANAHFRGELQ